MSLFEACQKSAARWAEIAKKARSEYDPTVPFSAGAPIIAAWGMQIKKGTIISIRTDEERKDFYPHCEYQVLIEGDFSTRVFSSKELKLDE
jgi:hypothetical protein